MNWIAFDDRVEQMRYFTGLSHFSFFGENLPFCIRSHTLSPSNLAIVVCVAANARMD